MLLLISLLAFVAVYGANAYCPSTVMNDIQVCVRPMSGPALQRLPDLDSRCRVALPALDCVGDLLNRCPHDPGVQQFLTLLNFNETVDMMQSACSGQPIGGNGPIDENDGCPPDYAQQITRCSNRVSGSNPSCSEMRAAVNCIGGLIETCRTRPGVREMSRILNIDTMRETIETHCGPTDNSGPSVETNNGGGNENCPSDYTQQLTTCAERMQNIGENPSCSEMNGSVECLENIMNRCPNTPAVRRIRDMVDVNALRNTVNTACGGSVTEPPTEIPCSLGDPVARLRRCNRYIQSSRNQPTLELKCGKILRGFRCLHRLIEACPRSAAVTHFTNMIHMDSAERVISRQCDRVQ